jgi:DHA1 family tetracycline resistance protein-like MFS transporter
MPSEIPRPRSTLPILFSVIIVDLIGFGIVVPVLPYITQDHGLNQAMLGLLLASYAAMQFIFAPIWGRLSDRVGRRPVMLATILGSSACLLLLGLTDSIVGLFVARILGGAFAANISVATAYLSDVTDESERTRWMGMVGASFGIGFLLGPPIGGVLALHDYSTPMIVAAGMAAINFGFAFFRLREPERHISRESGAKSRDLMRGNKSLQRFFAVNLFFCLAVAQLESMFVPFVRDRFQYDPLQAAMIMFAMAFVMGGIQGGGMKALAGRFGEKQLVIVGIGLMTVAFAAVPFIHAVPLLMVPLLISAVGRAISQPSLMSMVSLTATANQRGEVMGTFQSAASLARAIGPLVAGLLYDHNTVLPFLLASVFTGVAIVIGLGLPDSSEDAGEVGTSPAG